MAAHVVSGPMKFLGREEWHEPFQNFLVQSLEPVCTAFDLDLEELPVVLGEDHYMQVWGVVFEDFASCELADGANLLDDYLKRRGFKESATNKMYLKALRHSVMSLYEISDVVPDKSFLARDLVRGGEPMRVSEKSGTRYMQQWDRIAGRVMTVGPKCVMAGGVLPLDFATSEEILARLEQAERTARKKPTKASEGNQALDVGRSHALLEDERLRNSAQLFIASWLGHALERFLNPGLPELRNTEGEKILFCTSRFLLAPGTTCDALVAALQPVTDFRQDADDFFNWVSRKPDIGRDKASAPGEATVLLTKLDDGTACLGTITLSQDAVVLETNSKERAERGRDLLLSTLGPLVLEPSMVSRTPEQLMAAKQGTEPTELKSPLPPDQERAVLLAFLDTHYHKVLGEPVGMLDGLTPRRAVKTARGREKVVRWLKYIENQNAQNARTNPNLAGYDLGWIWHELGVADQRR